MPPSGSYRQIHVRCPFYRYDDAKANITCVGIVEDTRLILNYDTKADLNIQLASFCSDKYTYCEVYRMLYEIYGDCEDGTQSDAEAEFVDRRKLIDALVNAWQDAEEDESEDGCKVLEGFERALKVVVRILPKHRKEKEEG